MRKHSIVICLFAMSLAATVWAAAQEPNAAVKAASRAVADSGSSASRAVAVKPSNAAARIEGEKSFKANCSRCHMAPNKFPPRMAATIIRHMRVRASITVEDARVILDYMNQ